jgi:NADP-dependent 3-hydroxy acid dehydrogenase YdfG
LDGAGAFVVATALRADRLDELASPCGERIETIAGDITDAHHRHTLIERLQALGRLDVLVNNAGICDDGPIEQQSLDDLLRVIDVNLISGPGDMPTRRHRRRGQRRQPPLHRQPDLLQQRPAGRHH